MPFSAKQQEYLLNATHRWNIKTGATRSGKTYLDYTVIPKRIINCQDRGLILLLGNTKSTLERNILLPMRRLWTEGLVGYISSDNTVQLFGKRCYALGADKINQVSKIQGSGIEYCYGDEITTWHEDIFTMLKSRLDQPTSCFDGTCNPDNPHHWFKKFLDGEADIYQQAYTIDDNPFLDPLFVTNLKKEYGGTVYYDRFILGLWAAAEGVIYRQFADRPKEFIIDDIPAEDISFASIGVDFGGNGSATAFSCTGFTKGMQQMVTLEEYYRKEIISPSQLERDFIDFVLICRDKYKVYEAFCDSAEQTLIAGLRSATIREGLAIDIRNAKKGPINGRIRFFSRMMSSGRYKILRRCRRTIEALASAVWDARSVSEDRRLDDGNYNIDSLDAAEYSVEPHINNMIYGMR